MSDSQKHLSSGGTKHRPTKNEPRENQEKQEDTRRKEKWKPPDKKSYRPNTEVIAGRKWTRSSRISQQPTGAAKQKVKKPTTDESKKSKLREHSETKCCSDVKEVTRKEHYKREGGSKTSQNPTKERTEIKGKATHKDSDSKRSHTEGKDVLSGHGKKDKINSSSSIQPKSNKPLTYSSNTKNQKKQYDGSLCSHDSGTVKKRATGNRVLSVSKRHPKDKNMVEQPTTICFTGIQVCKSPDSHAQIVKLLDENGINYSLFSLLKSKTAKQFSDINLQIKFREEAYQCIQLMQKNFKVNSSAIIGINEELLTSNITTKHDIHGHPKETPMYFENAKCLEIVNLPPKTQAADLGALLTNQEICQEELRKIKIEENNRAVVLYWSRDSAINAVRKLYGVCYKGRMLDLRLCEESAEIEGAIFKDLKQTLMKEIEEKVAPILSKWDGEINKLENEVTKIKNSRKHNFILIDEAERIEVEKQGLMFKQNQLKRFTSQLTFCIEKLKHKTEQAINIETVGMIKNELCREIRKASNPLPIYAFRSDIINTVFSDKNNACVILGETGSGKSTQIAQYLVDADFLIPSDVKIKIACTQPRKVAAISLAKRVAEEYGCEVGEQIGYKVGSSQKTSLNTVVTFMTDRVLLNSLLQDPKLKGYSCIVIDEAHERSIDTDILITLLKKVSAQRPELKIVITSATIDEKVFCSYFNCPYMKIPGRIFPVETKFISSTGFNIKTNYVKEAVDIAEMIHTTKKQGDILVFLTSANEIERACGDLAKRLGIIGDNGNAQILPLHGKLQPQDQLAIFNAPPPGKRKIVFATNIAETSVTIDGVRYVIDTGMVKELKFDAKKIMSLLEVTTISQSSAEQRKGRAGRTSTGECFRLYSEKDYDEMEANNKPEILRVHLGMAVLQLLQLGIQDVKHFEFVQPPQDGALKEALKMLVFLGAVSDHSHKLTDLGKKVALLNLEPRLAKLVLTSIENDIAEEGIIVAGLLAAGGNVFYRSGSDVDKRKSDESKLDFSNVHGDVFTMLDVYDEWKRQPEKNGSKWCFKKSVNGKTMKVVANIIKDIKCSLKTNKLFVSKDKIAAGWKNEIGSLCLRKLIFSVYAQNLCIYNGHPKAGYTNVFQMKTGILHPSSSLKSLDVFPEWIVYTEFNRTTQDFFQHLTPVESDWIFEYHPQLANSIDITSLKDNQVHELRVARVGPTLMGRIIQKGGQGLRDIEENVRSIKKDGAFTMFCAIECCNKTGTIGLFVSRSVAVEAEAIVQQIVDRERDSLEKQQLEVAIGHSSSGVRQVIGKGAEPKFILMPEDFRTLEISGIHGNTFAIFENWLEKNHLEEYIHDKLKFSSHSKQASRGIWGKITFISPKIAKSIHQCFPENDTLKCKPACQGMKEQNGLGQELVATWKTGASKQIAFVNCQDTDDANRIRRALNRTIIKGSAITCDFKRNDGTSLFISRLNERVSEDDINNALTDLNLGATCKRVSIPRHPPVSEKTDVQFRENLKDLLVEFTHRAKIDVRFPQRRTQRSEDGIPRSRHVTAFITLNGVPTETINAIVARALLLQSNGMHQLAIKRLVKCRLFCPGYVYQVIEDDLMSLKHTAETTLKNARIWINDNKRDKSNRRDKSNDILINLEFKNPENMIKLQTQFVNLIDGNKVPITGSRNVIKEISGNYLRQFLNKCEKSTGSHAFYDRRENLVRVYGTERAVQNMVERISRFISEAENSHFEISLGDFTKAKGRALQKLRKCFGPDLNELKRMCSADSISYILKSRIIVVRGKDTAHKKSRNLIKDCLRQAGIEFDHEDAIQEDECGVCLSEVEKDSHRLEGCGHNYCRECLVNLMNHSIESNDFPVVCQREDCNQSLFMCDINLLTRDKETKEKLYSATLDTFIAQKSKNRYKYCVTPNCTMVYHLRGVKGKLFVCPLCNHQFCTLCRVDHSGMSCGEYNANKETCGVMVWAKKNEKDVKICKCGAVIEKTGGCRTMCCTRCRMFMCWICSKVFHEVQDCYDHLAQVHGGIFD
ncbi:uncharacterized protein [Antedon mediterranea]|uniref:uncharacterized protein n=1 Tax=Antedon mediterranea TaxID=105859 RepID=UPI003AF43329